MISLFRRPPVCEACCSPHTERFNRLARSSFRLICLTSASLFYCDGDDDDDGSGKGDDDDDILQIVLSRNHEVCYLCVHA